MNRFRIASIIGLVSGFGISIVGGGLADTLSGCTSSGGVMCSPSNPPTVVDGQALLAWGGIIIIISLVAFFSFRSRPDNGGTMSISWNNAAPGGQCSDSMHPTNGNPASVSISYQVG